MNKGKSVLSAVGLLSMLIFCGCNEPAPQTGSFSTLTVPPMPSPKGYVCYKVVGEIIPDGRLNEKSWESAPWTDYFADIEGVTKPEPRFRTRAKMLWDSVNLYIAAHLEEPHLWARLKQRDTVIFYDHDFEVFIDPDGDAHGYYELEVNALGTAWDLLLLKPYRDGGPPVNSWDIQGLDIGINLDGSLNDPSDMDSGWTVEMKLPLSVLKECAAKSSPPVDGDQWRINFSRVEWRTLISGGSYLKETDPKTGKSYPEDNWVWSPQGRINMHMPEMWGYVQFSGLVSGSGTEDFKPDIDLPVKWALRTIYYHQYEYFRQNQKYARNLAELGLTAASFPAGTGLPQMEATARSFEAWMNGKKTDYPYSIREDGRLSLRAPELPDK
ncbi:MAG TPA: carbohydrate-binding family 9-like protein [Bacteroidales bacterium]|nr:carbohydrate-binding family 9-like protein [Bacteroidales bacterium]